jgi:ABC-type cobalamin/Fe3+-siderophores transport system ATPase subunit
MDITIEAGRHEVRARDLVFRLDSEIRLTTKSIYYLTGENGAGKTTFLEQVCVPKLKRAGARYIFLGSDFPIQVLTMRTWVAIRKVLQPKLRVRADRSTNRNQHFINELIRVSGRCDILVADEIFRYVTADYISTILQENSAASALIVSHDRRSVDDIVAHLGSKDICVLNFQRRNNLVDISVIGGW